jgi:hypothetical protein
MNPDCAPEQPPGIRIVNHHRPPVAGPAHIELDSPDAAGDGCPKSGNRILDDLPVVVFAAVGDDPTTREALCRRTGLRIEPKEGICAAEKGVFDPKRYIHSGYFAIDRFLRFGL